MFHKHLSKSIASAVLVGAAGGVALLVATTTAATAQASVGGSVASTPPTISGPGLIAHGASVAGPSSAGQAASEDAGVGASMASTESSIASISAGIASAETRLGATTGSTAGTKISGPGLIGHTGSGVSASGTSAEADNTVIANCPNQTPGATCGVNFTVSVGAWGQSFCYSVGGGSTTCLTPYYGYCNYSACTYGFTGGGGDATPRYWILDGNDVRDVSTY